MSQRILTKRQAQRLVVALISLASAVVAIRAVPATPITSMQASPSLSDGLAVVRINDGDTIVVNKNGQEETVRLIGVDTPETKDPRKPVQCFGKEASAWTISQLQGQRVRLEADITQGDRDRYNRLLAYVYRANDNLLINQALISDGYGHEYTYQSNPYKYQTAFRKAEQSAREQGRGLWGADTCNGDTTQAVLK